MKTIRNEYESYIKEHFDENRTSALAVKDYLEHSSVAYHAAASTHSIFRKFLRKMSSPSIKRLLKPPMEFSVRSFRNIWIIRSIEKFFLFQRSWKH